MRRLLLLPLVLWSSASLAAPATSAGTPTAPHPTLEAVAIEWPVDGDDDLDGVVSVSYRVGGGALQTALPLRNVPADERAGHAWAHRHVGSIFGLPADSDIEVVLALRDPDGGDADATLRVRTRALPRDAADAVLVDVTPETFPAALEAAQPATVLQLGAGHYDGFVVAVDGEVGRPIVVRGAARNEVVIDGDVRLDGRAFVHLEALSINGKVKMNDSHDIVVQRCAITTTEGGIIAYGTGTVDGYFADNVITGPTTAWAEQVLGVSGDNVGEGIELTGAGNVIAHNTVRGFRDCISLMEGGDAVDQQAIDIVDNDLSLCADDGIEADFAAGNVRVLRNRITNSFIALSSQPGLGGPTYFARNVVFNTILSPFKLQRSSVGDVVVHNTVVKGGDAFGIYTEETFSRAFFRNNLFIGGEGGGTFNGFANGDGDVIDARTADDSCDFAHEGYGSLGTGRFSGRLGALAFADLATLQTRVPGAVVVDEAIFATTPESLASGPFPLRDPADLRLTAGAAVDVGEILPTLNDSHVGAAPDLGAYELGDDLPRYGARVDEAGEPVGEGEGEGEEGEGEGEEGEGEGEEGEGEGEDDDDDEAASGCTCGSAQPSPLALFALVALVVRVRRRQRR